jgi:hypothetical protein
VADVARPVAGTDDRDRGGGQQCAQRSALRDPVADVGRGVAGVGAGVETHVDQTVVET